MYKLFVIYLTCISASVFREVLRIVFKHADCKGSLVLDCVSLLWFTSGDFMEFEVCCSFV